MALIVQKFGGTSVATPECIKRVAEKIAATRAQGHAVVAVISAMSGETDRLIKLANVINPQPSSREYAALVATGEQASIALVALALNALGCSARSYTGAQIKIHTDSCHEKARIINIDESLLSADLCAGIIPVIAGFQGVSSEGEITTLGRGGSDTTAVALAAILQADECQIYTDVDGIYTADPKLVPVAQCLNHITLPEMLELASQGAKVMQQRAVELAGKYEVPLRILSSFNDKPGTVMTLREQSIERPVVSGLTSSKECLVSIKKLPVQDRYLMTELLGILQDENISIDMLFHRIDSEHGLNEISFTLPRMEYDAANKALKANYQNIEISGNSKIIKLSVIGLGLRSHPVIIRTVFATLENENIPVYQSSTTENKISVIVDESNTEQSLSALHTAFGLAKNSITMNSLYEAA